MSERRARSPYFGVLLLVAILVPLTLAAHVVLLFTAAPSPQKTCENAITIHSSSWPSTHASAMIKCEADLHTLETVLGEPGTALSRLRAANLRRCFARVRDVPGIGRCIEGLNDGWAGQLAHWP
jgi:hypothetical protein